MAAKPRRRVPTVHEICDQSDGNMLSLGLKLIITKIRERKNCIYIQFTYTMIQLTPENSGVGKRHLNSSYDFKQSPMNMRHRNYAVESY